MKEIKSTQHTELPEIYISFSEPLEDAMSRISNVRMKDYLSSKGLALVEPLKITRIEYMSETSKPHYMLAFELRKL